MNLFSSKIITGIFFSSFLARNSIKKSFKTHNNNKTVIFFFIFFFFFFFFFSLFWFDSFVCGMIPQFKHYDNA